MSTALTESAGRLGDIDMNGDGIPDSTEFEMADLLNKDVREHIMLMKHEIPHSEIVNDINADLVSNLGRRKFVIYDANKEPTNSVRLVQTARQSFQNELNKFKTPDEIKKGGDPLKQTLREFLFQQSGREPEVIREFEMFGADETDNDRLREQLRSFLDN